MSKKNGKKAVIILLGTVFAVSLFAWVIQKKIYANKDKPVEEAVVEDGD